MLYYPDESTRPLKARLHLLRDRESVDKFASFKLIDLVGPSIILEEFRRSMLMEIISSTLPLFLVSSISIIFPNPRSDIRNSKFHSRFVRNKS